MAIQLAESQQGGKSPANKHGAYWREYRGCVRGQKNRQADSSAAHRPVTESVFSVMIITAQGSIGDKPRPVPARAVVCIY